jgi:hypothetical protein
MMTKEKFKDLMYKMQEINEFEDKLYDMKIDIFDSKLVEYPAVFFDELMRSEFGEDGLDLISWWLYEDVDHKIYESDDNVESDDNAPKWFWSDEKMDRKVIADLNNIDDLYDYLTKGGRDEVNEE